MSIKNFIREQIKLRLNELGIDAHFGERLKSRILDASIVDVGYENGPGTYKIVGTYRITPEVKEKAMDAYNKLLPLKFGKNKSVAIKLLDLYLRPNDVNLMVNPEEVKGKTLLFVDKATNSNGNWVYAIIRNDTAMTLMFAKSYVPLTPQKLNVDYVLNKI